MALLPAEAGSHVVVAIGIGDGHARVHGVGVVDDKLAGLTIAGLLDERDFHALNEVLIIAIHIKEVHQVR